MLLALSEDALEKLQEEVEEAEKDSEYGSEEDELEMMPSGLLDSSASSKRKATGQSGDSRQAVKKRMGKALRPNRIYFRWRGRQPGTGEIETTQEDRHLGHFDFKNSGLTGQGVIVHPNFFGDEAVEMKIYKRDNFPQNEAEAWSNLGEERWDYERTARWH